MITIKLPESKDGVVISVDLTLTSSTDPGITSSERFYLFPKDAFFSLRDTLKGKKIGVLDPEQITRTLLENAGVPFEAIYSLDELTAFHGSLLIVGQGIDFDQNPNIGRQVLTLAQMGVPVLILAPINGSIRFVDGNVSFQPQKVILAQDEVIHESDKKLDRLWSPLHPTAINRFKMIPEEGVFRLEVTTGTDGWSWVQIDPKETDASVILCGFDIINRWDDSPAPRYFLLHLIEKLIDPKTEGGQ